MMFNIGDRIYCSKNEKYGFVTRLNAFGLKKLDSIGIQWDDKSRTIIFGKECMSLTVQ
jgi:hypothetical protein